jgi:hypothetical protein
MADIRSAWIGWLYGVECAAVHPPRPRLAFGDAAGIVSVVDLHGMEWGGAEGATDNGEFRPPRS